MISKGRLVMLLHTNNKTHFKCEREINQNYSIHLMTFTKV